MDGIGPLQAPLLGPLHRMSSHIPQVHTYMFQSEARAYPIRGGLPVAFVSASLQGPPPCSPGGGKL